MDTVLHGISGVMCYIDDILVSSVDENNHLEKLGEVFTRLQKHGFRLKADKCVFMMPTVQYLSHQIDSSGIHAAPDKVEAIVEAPVPKNVNELRSFLGLVNYYGKFIPCLSTILHPLNNLLKTGTKWEWSKECSQAFKQAKQNSHQLKSSPIMTQIVPLTLAADASAYGVGAVISHVYPDGSQKPIAFASNTLSESEKNYAQIEKEALSIVFGIKNSTNICMEENST